MNGEREGKEEMGNGRGERKRKRRGEGASSQGLSDCDKTGREKKIWPKRVRDEGKKR